MAPRILYAQSTIVSPLLDKETFCTWYDTVHIPELFNIPKSPDIAYRYRAFDETRQTWQILVMYLLHDPTFLNTPVPEGQCIYKDSRFPDRPPSDFLSFDGKDYAFVGDEGTILRNTEKSKWEVHAEFDVDDANSQQTEAALKAECHDGVGYSRYRLESLPSVGKRAVDYDGPKELALLNIDREEDIGRVIESLGQKLKDIGVQVNFATWEFVKAIAK